METKDLLTLIRFKNTTIVVFYVLIFSTLLTRSLTLSDFLLILLVNLLAIWSIYSFNDFEDSRMVFSLKKRKEFFHKNMIINGKIHRSEALTLTLILAFLSLLLSIKLSLSNFLIIASILLLGVSYSERNFRLKSKPPFDVLAHGLIGPLMSLSVLINIGINILSLLALSSFFLGSIVPEILNQRYDYFLDKKNKVKTTVQLLGRAFSLKLIIAMSFAIIVINSIIFLLYGGLNLLILYSVLSPLLIMFLFKKIRQMLERKPIILIIPVMVNMIVLIAGFLNLV